MKVKRKADRNVVGWYVTDHARNDAILRGPYKHIETAGAVREEMERAWDDRDGDRPDTRNLWVWGCETEADYDRLAKNPQTQTAAPPRGGTT